jgi:hypothetical protein
MALSRLVLLWVSVLFLFALVALSGIAGSPVMRNSYASTCTTIGNVCWSPDPTPQNGITSGTFLPADFVGSPSTCVTGDSFSYTLTVTAPGGGVSDVKQSTPCATLPGLITWTYPSQFTKVSGSGPDTATCGTYNAVLTTGVSATTGGGGGGGKIDPDSSFTVTGCVTLPAPEFPIGGVLGVLVPLLALAAYFIVAQRKARLI